MVMMNPLHAPPFSEDDPRIPDEFTSEVDKTFDSLSGLKRWAWWISWCWNMKELACAGCGRRFFRDRRACKGIPRAFQNPVGPCCNVILNPHLLKTSAGPGTLS